MNCYGFKSLKIRGKGGVRQFCYFGCSKNGEKMIKSCVLHEKRYLLQRQLFCLCYCLFLVFFNIVVLCQSHPLFLAGLCGREKRKFQIQSFLKDMCPHRVFSTAPSSETRLSNSRFLSLLPFFFFFSPPVILSLDEFILGHFLYGSVYKPPPPHSFQTTFFEFYTI